jgi:protein-tyrosine phosphatase
MNLIGAPNFRDLGGIQTTDGRVIREGLLFRSEVLSRLTQDDLERVRRFHIHFVCDLRSATERAQESNRWPEQEGVVTVARDDDADINGVKPSEWASRLLDHDFDESSAQQTMIEAYRVMPQRFAATLATLFAYVGRVDSGGVLVHCVAGKDRTGFVCAMLLWALGVPMAVIMADYLVSGERFQQSSRMQPVLRRVFGSDVPARAERAAAAIGTVKAKYLEAAFGKIEMDYGSINAYLAVAGGLDDKRTELLRQRLLITTTGSIHPAASIAVDGNKI